MKKATLIWIILLFHLQDFAQLHELLPMGGSGIDYGDTLLNPRSILKQENIRKITSYRVSSGTIKTFSARLRTDGTIEEKISCVRRKNSDSSFCRSDTVLFDKNGNVLEFRSKDAKGNIYLQCKVENNSDGRIKYTVIISTPEKTIPDTVEISYRYYNEKGQLVRVEYEGKGSSGLSNLSLYYNNKDSFLDSIRYDNRSMRTDTFKRIQKGKNKEIILEDIGGTHKWVYNSSDQCISYEWVVKNQPKYSRAESHFYYNPNGTLSKVIEKLDGKNYCTTSYSYEK